MDEQQPQPTQESIANPPVESQAPTPPSPEIQTPELQEQPISEPIIPADTSTQEQPTTTELPQPQESQQPESAPQETTLPASAEQSTPTESTKQEIQDQPTSSEGEAIEKQSLPRTVTEASEVSRTGVPRELNEEERQALYKSRLKALSTKGNQARSARRLANHQKIIEYLKQHGYITNDEVQKICGVKDSTATKYLKELQKLGQIIPVGRTSHIRWRLTQAI